MLFLLINRPTVIELYLNYTVLLQKFYLPPLVVVSGDIHKDATTYGGYLIFGNRTLIAADRQFRQSRDNHLLGCATLHEQSALGNQGV